MSKFIPLLAVASFVFFIFIYGACISGIVLREPDICFLLASGKWIVEHGQLPTVDPFSYSTIYHNVPYVIEKWLTEIIFYDLYKYTTAAGLLVFDAIVLTLTFTIMPYRFMRLNGVRGLRALSLAALSTFTSWCHLAVRPEIFSYLIVAIYLELLMRLRDRGVTLHIPSIIAFVVLMILWSNLHTLFIVGLMILGFYSACAFIEKQFKITETKMDWTAPLAFLLCIPATLATPYGVTLWQYLPNIFGPFNDTNNEMQPIGLAHLTSISLYPFFVLIIVSLIIFVRRALVKPTRPGELFFKALLPVGIAGGIKTIRTIPISDLFAAAGLAEIYARAETKISAIDEKIDELCDPMNAIWVAVTLTIAGLGAYCMTLAIPPDIPQSSVAFKPPLKAVAFIEQHRPQGRMLNDPHFGNVLMWKVDNNPPVFIDSRYNLFGNTLLQDYWVMAENKAGARALLDKYSIDWVFLNPKMELVKALSQDPDWITLYTDDEAAVIARKNRKGK